jgi:tRNA 2-selenouridine synthase
MIRPNTDDYSALFLNDIPLMDVRAPVEFSKGAFPGVVNLPLMNDEERRLVGIRYKQAGQDSAIELGHQLVSGDLKSQRIAQWQAFAKEHPQGYLYCFRGGLRSRITQQWLKAAGVDYPLIIGGYKAMRRFLIDTLEQLTHELDFVVLSGRTGTGKTRLLNAFRNSIDLEAIARHRGSSFGRMLSPQPSQIDFENSLAIALLKAKHIHAGPVYIEDESRLIGRCALPLSFKHRLAESPIVLLDASLDERVEVVLQDYVIDMTRDFIARDGEVPGMQHFSQYLFASLERIERRLGNERKNSLMSIMQDALAQQQTHTGQASFDGHRVWIRQLLKDYYDPMYDYQLEKKIERVRLRGDKNTLKRELLK